MEIIEYRLTDAERILYARFDLALERGLDIAQAAALVEHDPHATPLFMAFLRR